MLFRGRGLQEAKGCDKLGVQPRVLNETIPRDAPYAEPTHTINGGRIIYRDETEEDSKVTHVLFLYLYRVPRVLLHFLQMNNDTHSVIY